MNGLIWHVRGPASKSLVQGFESEQDSYQISISENLSFTYSTKASLINRVSPCSSATPYWDEPFW